MLFVALWVFLEIIVKKKLYSKIIKEQQKVFFVTG
jgi:hypothetical protein